MMESGREALEEHRHLIDFFEILQLVFGKNIETLCQCSFIMPFKPMGQILVMCNVCLSLTRNSFCYRSDVFKTGDQCHHALFHCFNGRLEMID